MSLLLADIDATCSSLGCYDGNKYYAEGDAVQGLKVFLEKIILIF
jgi:timeless